MDNKNSSEVEELEIVGLSQNDILKDKLSEFFVGTSVASSSNKQNSSIKNNNYSIKYQSEISGINRKLISSSKSNTENEKNKNEDESNCLNTENNNIKLNYVQNGKCNGTESYKKICNIKEGEKFDTVETFNNKDTGDNSNEKLKEQKNEKNKIGYNKRMLKDNRNKSYFILESSNSKNSSIKGSSNLK